MTNIIISDSFFNVVPRDPKIVQRDKVKLLAFDPVIKAKRSGKTGWLMDGTGAATFNPYELGRWDFHRALIRDYEKNKWGVDGEGFMAWVVSLAECVGDLFESFPLDLRLTGRGVGTPIHLWESELEDLQEAIRLIDAGQGQELRNKKEDRHGIGKVRRYRPSTLQNKLKEFTFPELDYKQKKTAKDSPLALGTESLIGWCWLMVAREVENGVTYKECRGFSLPHRDPHSGLDVAGCGRLVPSLNGKNNPQTVCSKNCSARADRAAKKAAKTPEK